MFAYGSIPSTKESNHTHRRRCCILLLISFVISIISAGCTLGVLYYLGIDKQNHIVDLDEASNAIDNFEDEIIDEGIEIGTEIVNELNHPKAMDAMEDSRELLRTQKGGPVMDPEFREYYNLEQACCTTKGCSLCAEIAWFCCDEQMDDDDDDEEEDANDIDSDNEYEYDQNL